VGTIGPGQWSMSWDDPPTDKEVVLDMLADSDRKWTRMQALAESNEEVRKYVEAVERAEAEAQKLGEQ